MRLYECRTDRWPPHWSCTNSRGCRSLQLNSTCPFRRPSTPVHQRWTTPGRGRSRRSSLEPMLLATLSIIRQTPPRCLARSFDNCTPLRRLMLRSTSSVVAHSLIEPHPSPRMWTESTAGSTGIASRQSSTQPVRSRLLPNTSGCTATSTSAIWSSTMANSAR